MEKKLFTVLLILFVIFTFMTVYSGFGSEIYLEIIKWGEIVIVFSLVAGIARVLKSEILRVKTFKFESLNSVVILVSFIITFLAGMYNFNQSKYTFNNLIREQPQFLREVVETIINDDFYMSRFPAKEKLILLVSSKISPYFSPTEEMLKNADITRENLKKIQQGTLSENDVFYINSDDLKILSEIEEKSKSASIEIISILLPLSNGLKSWFLKSVHDYIVESSSYGDSVKIISDFTFETYSFENSGNIMQSWLKNSLIEVHDNGQLEFAATTKYAEFIAFSGISDIIAGSFPLYIKALSKPAAQKLTSNFLKTGVTSSPKMKGFVRWIYRSVFDPLLSTFIALLFFSMILTAYRKFDIRNYSYSLILLSFCSVLIGFLPSYQSFISSFIKPDWTGPFVSGWLMNVFSAPVFKVFVITTGAGFIYFSVEMIITTIFNNKKREES